MDIRIERYQKQYRSQVLDVWERSVRATHHFLNPDDIGFYRDIVHQIDFTLFDVFCAFSGHNNMVGILGVASGKLEMLFLVPEQIGKGVGKKLVDFAIKDQGVTSVDVNEANTHAVAFYEKAGFARHGRTPVDDQGKPYPIIKMRLARA